MQDCSDPNALTIKTYQQDDRFSDGRRWLGALAIKR